MRDTYVPAGTPVMFLVSSFQVPPSFHEIQRRPSSVPAKMMPGRIGDSLSDTMLAKVSAPVASVVMPPVVCVEMRIFVVSAEERSGEIGYMSSPIFVDFSTRFAPKYSTCGLCFEMRNGVFQFQRMSRSTESRCCGARNPSTRFFSSFDSGLVVSGHCTTTESSPWMYLGGHCGFTRPKRSLVETT